MAVFQSRRRPTKHGAPFWRTLRTRLRSPVLFAVLLAGVMSETLLANQVEAKKDGVTVVGTPDKSGAVVATLKAGETLDAGERKGMYWEVKTADGKSGFVSVMAVKLKPSSGKLGSAIRDAVMSGRNTSDAANARARSAVMGVRGLDESGETAFAGSVKPDLRAVYSLEDFEVPAKRVERLGEEVFEEIAANANAR